MAVRTRHQFPLRAGAYLAQVMAPPDMTMEEALRLSEFIRSLAVPESTAAPARGENRFFAESVPHRASAVMLWRVRFEATSIKHKRKPRTRKFCLLVSAGDERGAMSEGQRAALAILGQVAAIDWHSTELVTLPLDLSAPENKAFGAGKQSGFFSGFSAGFIAAMQSLTK